MNKEITKQVIRQHCMLEITHSERDLENLLL